uniref:hypothetical protein n=1 Tax=uncultured Ruminococcus sp. TaxID=165186 RepID=UPI0025EBEDC9|nr:hypothetical protein [uncultured Ruminococcus sp.]
MRDYEELTSEWEELLEVLRCCQADLDAVKHLIFDTYHFLKNDLKGDSVSKNRLELYKYISQACRSLYLDYPLGMKKSDSLAFFEFASGLCFVFETAFVGYEGNSMRVDFYSSMGFDNSEADMTSYESFEKDFELQVGI